MMNAINEWEEYTGKHVDIVVPLEVGGSNLPAPMAVAAMMDKKIVDGDYAGRAIPEIFQISLQKEDVNLCPAVSFDKYGNVSIIKSAISLTIAERIGKYLSEVAFGSTAIAGFPITGKQLKRLLVRGTVSQAYRAGELIEEAKAVEAAGAFAIVLECIPAKLAKLITESVSIPTIGIGAGADCDGQVLVYQDMLALFSDFKPKFVKHFANAGEVMKQGFTDYIKEVKEGTFPAAEHTFKIADDIINKLY